MTERATISRFDVLLGALRRAKGIVYAVGESASLHEDMAGALEAALNELDAASEAAKAIHDESMKAA